MIEDRSGWDRALVATAGLLGAAGVALGAASAHIGGGDLARLASFFLLLHGTAIPGILAVEVGSKKHRRWAATTLGLGAALFSGDLAVLAFTGVTPLSGMAPLGGLMLIAGWLTVGVSAVSGARSL